MTRRIKKVKAKKAKAKKQEHEHMLKGEQPGKGRRFVRGADHWNI